MSQAFCHDLALVDRIATLLSAQPQLRLCGLIDGIVENASLEQFFLLAPEADYEPLFLGTEHEACLPRSPYLFWLDNADASFLQEWGCWAQHGVTWYLSGYSLDEQASHWRSLVTVTTPEHNTAIFRFWDSRVLSPCLQFCTPDERLQLLAPCHGLFAPQINRYWQYWPGASEQSDLTIRNSPWWHMQPRHLQGYQTAFEQLRADEIEDTLWRQEPARIANLFPPALPTLIRQNMRQAESLGLTQQEAQGAFIRCQLRFGFDYWQHESLSDLWQSQSPRDKRFLEWANVRLGEE